MTPLGPRRDGQRGFTLIELMVASALVTLVIGMTLQLAFTMIEGFRTQRSALAIERNARGSIDLLATAARAVSTGVMSGDLRDAHNCTDVVALDVTNGDQAPDRIRLIYGLPGVLTSTRADVTATTTQFLVDDATGLAIGEQIIITDGEAGRVFPVDGLSGDTITTSFGACAGMPMPTLRSGSVVVRARVAELYIANASDGTPMLIMDSDGDGAREPEPVAEGIEDLQIAVGVDLDSDGALLDNADDTDEWFYNDADDADPPAASGGLWRALRITIVARDVAEGAATSARPAAEDHDAGADDGHRRRVLSTTIEIRNFQDTD